MNLNLIQNNSNNAQSKKENLIDHTIIYNSKKSQNGIFNYVYINESKKSNINYPLFPFPFNIAYTYQKKSGTENELDDKDLANENSNNYLNQSNKDEKKKENKEFLNKKRKVNSNDIYGMSSDKIVKKIRMIILNSIFKYINEKIRILFNNNIGRGICIKQLLPINKSSLYHTSVEHDKEFLNKKLKLIFSSISYKYTNVLASKNKDLIEELINLEDKGNDFKELFELTFLDCLEHIRGTKYSELLNDLPKIDDLFKDEGKNMDENILEYYKYFINNYELITKNKKTRNLKI